MVLVAVVLAPILFGQHSRTAPPGEYDVKAVFLLNFVRFVEWPPPPPERANSPIAICALGDDPFGESLPRVIATERVSGRTLVVKHPRKLPDDCDVLFFPASYPSQAAVLAQAGPNVLTVGDGAEFLHDGGMIRFVLEDRRVRFDVNRQAVDRSLLKVSSRLLAVARTVLK